MSNQKEHQPGTKTHPTSMVESIVALPAKRYAHHKTRFDHMRNAVLENVPSQLRKQLEKIPKDPVLAVAAATQTLLDIGVPISVAALGVIYLTNRKSVPAVAKHIPELVVAAAGAVAAADVITPRKQTIQRAEPSSPILKLSVVPTMQHQESVDKKPPVSLAELFRRAMIELVVPDMPLGQRETFVGLWREKGLAPLMDALRVDHPPTPAPDATLMKHYLQTTPQSELPKSDALPMPQPPTDPMPAPAEKKQIMFIQDATPDWLRGLPRNERASDSQPERTLINAQAYAESIKQQIEAQAAEFIQAKDSFRSRLAVTENFRYDTKQQEAIVRNAFTKHLLQLQRKGLGFQGVRGYDIEQYITNSWNVTPELMKALGIKNDSKT